MRRDMELVRKILLRLEGEQPADLSAYSAEQIEFHLRLLGDARFVDFGEEEPFGLGGGDPEDWFADPTRLTWQGCEFLAASAEPSVWKTAMSKAGQLGGAVAFPVLMELLVAEAKRRVGLTG